VPLIRILPNQIFEMPNHSMGVGRDVCAKVPCASQFHFGFDHELQNAGIITNEIHGQNGGAGTDGKAYGPTSRANGLMKQCRFDLSSLQVVCQDEHGFVCLECFEDMLDRVAPWQGRNQARKKTMAVTVDESHDSRIVKKTKQAMRTITLEGQSSTDQKKVTHVKTQSNDPFTLGACSVEVFQTLDAQVGSKPIWIANVKKTVHDIRREMLLHPFGQPSFRAAGIGLAEGCIEDAHDPPFGNREKNDRSDQWCGQALEHAGWQCVEQPPEGMPGQLAEPVQKPLPAFSGLGGVGSGFTRALPVELFARMAIRFSWATR
jgi:hypothetical protein